MQIHKCDVCGVIGEPGIQWVRMNLMPFTIQQPNRYVEAPCYEELYMDVCSMKCAAIKIQEFDFVEVAPPELKAIMERG